MLMPMMSVGIVFVRVRHVLMRVPVRVRPIRRAVMRVPMVFVVHMLMLVAEYFVRVSMRMVLGQVQPHARRHQGARAHQ